MVNWFVNANLIVGTFIAGNVASAAGHPRISGATHSIVYHQIMLVPVRCSALVG